MSVTVQVDCANFLSCKVQIYFNNIYLNLLLMHAQVGTDSQCVSPDIYESLLHGNREMHRQHHPKTPEIVNRFGNHERALRTAEGELVGITPAAAAFLEERLFTGGSVPRNRLLVPDGTPLHDVAALVPGAVARNPFGIGVDRGD